MKRNIMKLINNITIGTFSAVLFAGISLSVGVYHLDKNIALQEQHIELINMYDNLQNNYDILVEEYNRLSIGGDRLIEDLNSAKVYIDTIESDIEHLQGMLSKYQDKLGILNTIVTDDLKPIKFEVTAYSRAYKDIEKTKSDPYYYYNASMNKYIEGRTVAADTSILPFGTKIYIPALANGMNDGIYVVEDRGGAIKGNKLDIFIEDTTKSDAFGRQKLDVYVLEVGNGKRRGEK